ncbi:EsV-1-21 [Ectocarpus siliculosus]|uniref:EsV-1-21 n=1 Tax=Ectocarpus siliculosus TaxID=2880 RepID=D8LP53_ECTSI|nr:EsV-1-21 [Ectocarpus siliculosus]|eukprot:CBN80324.1 EsV-1-21 [Ectocarpus siliculosus]
MAAPGSMNNTLAKKLKWARTDLGYSPLHIASEDGRTEDVVNLLVSSEGKGTDDFQGGGKTALMLAAREGHAHVARELLNHGADINKKSVKCEKTALHFAAGCGQDEVAVLLVRRGADVETWDSTSESALLLSAKGGHLRVVNTLVLRGASVCCDTVGLLRCGVEEGFHEAFNNVLDGNLQDGLPDGYESRGHFLQTALLKAAESGNLPVVKALSTKGVDLDGTAEYHPSHSDIIPGQATALHAAAFGGHNDVVNFLLENSVRIDAVDGNMMTPLICSVSENHLCVSATLLEAGAAASAEDQTGTSSLSYAAASSSSVDMALLLLRYGADVNTRCYLFGSSVLHNACTNRDNTEALVDLLLRWGADETVVDSSGRTPMNHLTEDRFTRHSAETKDKVRKLLVNAPADRTWRRRGWLVMLCERERRKTEKKGCKVARTEEGIVLGGMAAWLLAVTDEGVLRTVVGFL